MNTEGWFVFRFDWLSKKPPFSDEVSRKELLDKINEIPGLTFDADVLKKRARIPFDTLTTGSAIDKLNAHFLVLADNGDSRATPAAKDLGRNRAKGA